MSKPTPKEIREAYKDFRQEWQEIRDEAAIDMRYVAGDPWEPEDRKERESAGRPCLSLDETTQYLNQYVNNLRQNKRAIQTTPKGNGANDETAKKRSSLIMGIEERSHAQPVYLYAAQCAAERSYGYSVIRTEYSDDKSFDQDIWIKPILNPDTVLLSPFYKQPDASDVPDAFLLELIPKKTFLKKYKDAKMTDFSGEVMGEQGVRDWITDKNVQVAEYWRIESEYKKILLVESGSGSAIFSEEEWKQAREHGIQGEVKRDRQVEVPKVMQYMTNGVEILDEVPWAGKRIPIISCFGKELWLTQGGSAKRKLLSMVRLARDPQMLLAYLATQECEEAGMIPKAPFVGAKGQFESDKDAWESVNKQPYAFLQYDIVFDTSTGQPLPPPSRPQYEANFQQWELAKDSARRSIQAAMGISPLPTAAQRQNQKSGVALEKIQTQEQIGSFHFQDNFESGYMYNMGWQINDLITPILDTEREVAVSEPDGSRTTMHLVGNTSHPVDEQGKYDVQGLPEDHLHTGGGDFGVTISTGPNYQSQREEQSEFVDKLIAEMPNLPPPGSPGAKVLALGIRMRSDLGPIGEQMADIFDPPDPSNLPPQAQAIVAQLQGQMQQLEGENQQLKMEKAAKMMEQQGKLELEQIRGQHKFDAKTIDFITQIVKAELAAKSKASEQQAQSDADKELQTLGFHEQHIDNAHEYAMQQEQHEHESEQADRQAQVASAQQATQISADQQAQASKPAGQ